MLFFVALFPYFVLQGADTLATSRRWGCLLPPTCLALGTVAFSEFEDSGEVGVVCCVVLRWGAVAVVMLVV